LQSEAFCQLVESLGWTKVDAYEATGHKRDRANAVKFSEREDIATRRRELQVERESLGTLSGEAALRKILEGALHSGDWGTGSNGGSYHRRVGSVIEEAWRRSAAQFA
jgi:hypothetical protein